MADAADEFPEIREFGKLYHAWILRAFEDITQYDRRVRQMWRTLGRTIGGHNLIDDIDAEDFDLAFVPQAVYRCMVHMCRAGAEDVYVAYSVRNIMPQLIKHYFPHRVQVWYYVESRNFPTPYVFSAPLNVTSDPELTAIRTGVLGV